MAGGSSANIMTGSPNMNVQNMPGPVGELPQALFRLSLKRRGSTGGTEKKAQLIDSVLSS
jgi:hypothetical protein